MQTGFVDIDGKTYYFAENGKKQTGWQDIKETLNKSTVEKANR